ncbi:MAG TPA: hypothetical protein VFH45_10370 [Acidimicrobiales bacterium]|nr:hypothetical protein [Acidimicrobiales bacterium]
MSRVDRALVALCAVLIGAALVAAAPVLVSRSHRAVADTTPDRVAHPTLSGLSAGAALPVGRMATPTTVRAAPPMASPAGRMAPTGVGVVTIDVYDPSRPTVAGGRMLSSSRHLPTMVRYPAVGPRGGQEVAGAPPASGPWPLVVFAHGYDVTPATYLHLLHAWAAAGFVVAAPSFPLEAAGGPLDESDLQNEPADISTVIGALLQQSGAGDGPLAHLVDPRRIAVAGHSDGAMAALGAAFGREDPRIGPVISMSGATSPGIPHADPHHPLLVIQGDADPINAPVNGWYVYSAAARPRILLDLIGGGHLPPIADDNPWRPVVEAVTIDFLRHYFWLGSTVGDLARDGSHPGVSHIGGEA